MLLPSILLTLLGFAAAVPVAQSDGPPTKDITIESINYAGTGCPAGSVAGTLSDAKNILTLAFDSYVAQSGPNINPSEQRKACTLTIKIKYPSGYQYSLFTADYRGYAAISSGSNGTIKSQYYFSSAGIQVCSHLKRFRALVH